MFKNVRLIPFVLATSIVSHCLLPAIAASPPKLHLWNINALDHAREQFASGKTTAAIRAMIRKADKDVEEKFGTVVDKTMTPPSGDKHDFMSIGHYYWPNPDTPNGLPWLNRDGQVNESLKTEAPDPTNFYAMEMAVEELAIAYYITGDEKYSAKGDALVKAWFVDPATKMNPNLNFAGGVPGKSSGHPTGSVELHYLPPLLDAITLLKHSPGFTAEDQKTFRDWCIEYMHWQEQSKLGKEIKAGKQNISTWVDCQIVALALYIGNLHTARTYLQSVEEKRIAAQIDGSGLQHEEVKRTNGLGYSMFNLDALTTLAHFGDEVGVDLWHYEAPNGASIQKAFDFVLPYLFEEKKWPYKQIIVYAPNQATNMIFLANQAYKGRYAHYLNTFGPFGELGSKWPLVYCDEQKAAVQ